MNLLDGYRAYWTRQANNSPSAQGTIPHLQSETLLQSGGLPGGFYTFYLGYDPVQNRWIDFDTLEIDGVLVIIGN